MNKNLKEIRELAKWVQSRMKNKQLVEKPSSSSMLRSFEGKKAIRASKGRELKMRSEKKERGQRFLYAIVMTEVSL